jgi:hypothetical protein
MGEEKEGKPGMGLPPVEELVRIRSLLADRNQNLLG